MESDSPDLTSTDGSEPELLNRGYRYALALTHHREDAEDLVQEAWLSLQRRYGRVETAALLFTTIRRLVIDRHRRAKIVRFEPIEDSGLWPDEASASSGAQSDLWTLLGHLREAEREALFLHHVEGHTAEEIGRLTAQPRNTVLSLLHRGMNKLRQIVAPQPDPES